MYVTSQFQEEDEDVDVIHRDLWEAYYLLRALSWQEKQPYSKV